MPREASSAPAKQCRAHDTESPPLRTRAGMAKRNYSRLAFSRLRNTQAKRIYTEGHEGHKEMGDQLGGRGTNSEGQVKYCRWSNIAVARFLDMPRRSASLPRPMSGRAMRHEPPSPHLSSPFASFRVFRGPHSLGKAGDTYRTETQFLIGLRVLCGLLCSALSTLGSPYSKAIARTGKKYWRSTLL